MQGLRVGIPSSSVRSRPFLLTAMGIRTSTRHLSEKKNADKHGASQTENTGGKDGRSLQKTVPVSKQWLSSLFIRLTVRLTARMSRAFRSPCSGDGLCFGLSSDDEGENRGRRTVRPPTDRPDRNCRWSPPPRSCEPPSSRSAIFLLPVFGYLPTSTNIF